jgi:hypothetical protein
MIVKARLTEGLREPPVIEKRKKVFAVALGVEVILAFVLTFTSISVRSPVQSDLKVRAAAPVTPFFVRLV